MGTVLPKDPVMLLSYVNTQLRDFYGSLEEFSRAADVPEAEITEKLAGIDYRYDAAVNQFV